MEVTDHIRLLTKLLHRQKGHFGNAAVEVVECIFIVHLLTITQRIYFTIVQLLWLFCCF